MNRALHGLGLIATGVVVIPATLAAAAVAVTLHIVTDEWKRFKSTSPRPQSSRPR